MIADSRADVLVEWADRVVAAEEERVEAEEDAELNDKLVRVLADLAALTLDIRRGEPLGDDCVTRALRQWLGEELLRWVQMIERNRR